MLRDDYLLYRVERTASALLARLVQSLYSPDEDMMLVRMKHVKSDEMWIKDNPGSQGVIWSKAGRRGERVVLLTGSFNPQPW